MMGGDGRRSQIIFPYRSFRPARDKISLARSALIGPVAAVTFQASSSAGESLVVTRTGSAPVLRITAIALILVVAYLIPLHRQGLPFGPLVQVNP